MRTKLPTALALGDRLAAYDRRGQRVAPVRVLRASQPVGGLVFVDTVSGQLRMDATLPVEIED